MHPIIARLFREAERQGIGILDLAKKSKVNKNTLGEWRNSPSANPTIKNLERAFSALGYRVSIRKRQ